jgi:glycosyltransferase involved in cell wall biosynthesis
MGVLFLSLFLSCVILIIIHIIFVGVNSFQWAVNGVDVIVKGNTFIETIYYSSYLKWIGLADIIWWSMLGIFLFSQKRFKTNLNLHYLDYNKIKEPKISVIIPTYNEENNIKQVVTDFIKQKNVKHVIVVDNNSTDSTVDNAKKSGATVITKDQNMGYAHSWYIGFKESLKMKDANVTVLCDADLTYSAYDLEKMVPYLDNCDMVVGNRLVQVLSQKGNQNSSFLVWGNAFIAKLLQIKYFSIHHLGFIQMNDAGCSFRCIRNESLQLFVNDFVNFKTNELVFGANSVTIGMFTATKAIEHDLKIVEVPITFKKRSGISKTQATKKIFALKYGFLMIWYIIKS